MSARALAGRARRLARAVVARVWLRGYFLRACLARRRAYIVVSGGRKATVVGAARSARVAAGLRVPVELLVLDFSPKVDIDSVLAGLPETVEVRRFWRDAAPGGGGASPRHAVGSMVPTQVPGPRAGTWRTGYFQEGKPVLSLSEHGPATAVEHYGRAGRPVCRDELDGHGALVRITDLHPDSRTAVTHRYLDSTGECWLSVWIDPADGSYGRTQQHAPRPREFRSLRAAQADWVGERVAGTTRARVLAAGAVGRAIARMIGTSYATIGADGSMRPRS